MVHKNYITIFMNLSLIYFVARDRSGSMSGSVWGTGPATTTGVEGKRPCEVWADIEQGSLKSLLLEASCLPAYLAASI